MVVLLPHNVGTAIQTQFVLGIGVPWVKHPSYVQDPSSTFALVL